MSTFWCVNQITNNDTAEIYCFAHILEDRVLICPYAEPPEHDFRCEDYEPVRDDSDIYACAFCGQVMRRNILSECGNCGRFFCADCFARQEGLEVLGEMITRGERILCPTCHSQAVDEDDIPLF